MRDRMREQGEFEQPRIVGEQLPHVFEHGGTGVSHVHGPREENLLGDLGAVEAVLEKTGVTKPKKPGRTLDKLIQRGIVPDSDEWRELTGTEMSAGEVRKAKLGLLGEIEEYSGKIDLVGREKDTGWSDLRDRAEEEGLDADAFAKAYDERREAAANIATPTTPEPAQAPNTPEPGKVFYPELAEDLARLSELSVGLGLKNPDRGVNTIEIRMIRRKLEEAGVNIDKLPDFLANPVRDRAAAIAVSAFKDAVTMLFRKDLRDKYPEFLEENRILLESYNIDADEIVNNLDSSGGVGQNGTQAETPQAKLDAVMESLDGFSVAQKAQQLQRVMNNIVRQTGKAVPKEYLEKLTELRGLIADVEMYDTDARLMRNRDQRTESPLQRELGKPFPGGKLVGTMIDEVYGSQRNVEVTAVSPDKSLSIKRLRSLLANFWSEEMGKLTGEARDLQLVGQAFHSTGGAMQNLVDSLKTSIASAQNLEGRSFVDVLIESFPSLKPREGDPLGTRELYDYFVEHGFSPSDPRVLEIQEVRIKIELEGLCDLQIALSDELGVLKVLREKAQKIDEIGEVVMPFSSDKIAALWQIGEMFQGEDRLTGERIKPIEDYQDQMMRMYWAISKVSDLGVGESLRPEDRAKIPAGLEKFIRDNLTVYVPIENEDGRKYERYVLNRWAYAPADRLKQIDEFMLLSARLDLFQLFQGGNIPELDSRVRIFDREFRERLSGRDVDAKKIGIVDSSAEVAVKFAKVRAETDIPTLGMAEQMGSYRLVRSVKQKDGGNWDLGDMEKASKRGILFRLRPGGSPNDVGDYERITQLAPTSDPAEFVIIERKAIGYPASSDLVKLTRVFTKLDQDMADGVSYGSRGLEVAMKRGFIPSVWIANYLQATKIIEGGREVDLWSLWWNGDQKLSEIATKVVRADRDMINIDRRAKGGVVADDKGVDNDAYTKWRKGIKATYGFWKLMKSEDIKDLQNFFNGDLTEAISAAKIFGLPMPELSQSERKNVLAIMEGALYAFYYVLHYGYTGQQFGSALQRTKGEAATVASSLNTDRTAMLMAILRDDKILNEVGRRAFKSILVPFGAGIKTGLINPTLGPYKWLDRWNRLIPL